MIKSHVRAALCCLLVLACQRKPGAPLAKPAMNTLPAQSSPALEFVPEMQPFTNAFVMTPPNLEATVLQSFASLWRAQAPEVCKKVTSDSLAQISRWAVDEMKSFRLPEKWWEKIPLRPMGVSADSQTILFGQYKEDGLPLPSHSPIVFRRLILAVCYHLPSQSLDKVIVSIGGWVEE